MRLNIALLLTGWSAATLLRWMFGMAEVRAGLDMLDLILDVLDSAQSALNVRRVRLISALPTPCDCWQPTTTRPARSRS